MHVIQSNKISLTRGDTLNCQVGIILDESPYSPTSGDVVKFYLKRSMMNPSKTAYADSKPLIEKTIPNDTMILHLNPADTKSLPFGDYVYDCEITFANGDKDTFINNASFVLLPEVG